MAGVTRFEDLIAWQKARERTREIYRITSSGKFASDFGLKDQIRRAAVSAMSNIAEGFERKRSSEFHQALSIANGSCAEVRSQLYVALDAGHLTEQEFGVTMSLAGEANRVIGGLRSTVECHRDEDKKNA